MCDFYNANKLYLVNIRGNYLMGSILNNLKDSEFLTIVKDVKKNNKQNIKYYKDIFSKRVYSTDEHDDLHISYILPLNSFYWGKYIYIENLCDFLQTYSTYITDVRSKYEKLFK